MNPERFVDYCIDIGPMGPIGEGEALILRATRNCPWNRCLFCPTYKEKRFERRGVEEIKGDINTVKRISELIEETSWKIGWAGKIGQEVITEVVHSHPDIYGRGPSDLTPENYIARRTLTNVVNWMWYGKRRVFLQDADSLIMRPHELVEVLDYLKTTFPTVEIVTSYARSRTCAQRTPEQLKELKRAGLSWLFVGIESGCDEVLRFMQKGVTAREHIEGGHKVMEAGINLAAFIMPGLAGKDQKLSERHVSETIRVLNEIRPTEIRIRSLAILEDSPLYAKWQAGEFDAPSEDQMIDELKAVIEGLNFDCIFETLQMTNVLFNVRVKLSTGKSQMLAKIAQYKAMPLLERLRFRLDRYLYDGYLDYIEVDSRLYQLIKEAKESLEKGLPEAEQKVEQAIFAIKAKGIP
ncbi:MAG: radical SAM protein [Syntrophorhabdales bacterium]|nr:radical SAM protein [Syntrophorhabdales bacterium]